MELSEWFQPLNVSALKQAITTSESSLFFAYAVVCFFIKRPVFLLAFFISFFLVNAEIAQAIKEYQVYLIVIIIYSYVFDKCKTEYSKICCGIIICISITFASDAFFYGVDGYHGTIETAIYNNIGSIALYAHILFISSLINYRRVWNNILGFFANVEHITYYGYNIRYLIQKAKKL